MNKEIRALAALAVVLASPVQAAGPIVDNVVTTVQAVLAAPGGTITNVVKALPAVLDRTAAIVANVSNVVAPALLGSGPIQSTTETITVPLPGPAFLDADLIKIKGVVSASISLSNPVTVTITTGP